MELVADNSGGGLCCVLLAQYCKMTDAIPRSVLSPTDKTNSHHLGDMNSVLKRCKISILTQNAVALLSVKDKLPFLVDGNLRLKEPLTIMKYLISQAGSEIERVLCNNTNPYDESQTDQWLSFCSQRQFCVSDPVSLNFMNEQLEGSTFIASNNTSLADLCVYCSLFNWMRQASRKERLLFKHICRWFDHVQHLPGILSGNMNQYFHMIPNIQDMLIEENMNSAIHKARAAAVDQNTGRNTDTACKKPIDDAKKPTQAKDAEKPTQAKNAKKPTKADEGKEQKTKDSASEPSADVSGRPIDDIARLDVRVGVITNVWNHPDAEKLYCEQIDIGETTPRDIASGLRPYMSLEQMMGARVLVLSNMKPKKVRGYMSNGMVMCVSSKDKSVCEFLKPPPNAPIGERITWEGHRGDPDSVLSTKTGKDSFVALVGDLNVKSEKIGLYKNIPWMTSQGPCTCDTVTDGTIS